MTKREFEYSLLVLGSFFITIGYGTLAHTFFTQLIASADFEAMGFPFTLASHPYSKIAIANIATAMSVGSSIILPAQLAKSGIRYNYYLQRRLNQTPEKQRKQRKPRERIMPWTNVISLFTPKSKSKKKNPGVKSDRKSDETPDHWN